LVVDGDGNHVVDANDFDTWKINFGAHFAGGAGGSFDQVASNSPARPIPEPATLGILLESLLFATMRRRISRVCRVAKSCYPEL
jgi:hypothetical protein